MRHVRPGWKKGAVFVCANQRPPDAVKPSCGVEAGRALRENLKARAKKEGLKGDMLVANSGCLGICPKGAVTVTLVPAEPGAVPVAVVVKPGEEDEIWEEARRYFGCGEPGR